MKEIKCDDDQIIIDNECFEITSLNPNDELTKPYPNIKIIEYDVKPTIILPNSKVIQTIIPHIKLIKNPKIINKLPPPLPNTTNDRIRKEAERIDIKKLNPGRKTPKDGTYPLNPKNTNPQKMKEEDELEPGDTLTEIAERLGLTKSGNKKDLVNRILEKIKDLFPEKFMDSK